MTTAEQPKDSTATSPRPEGSSSPSDSRQKKIRRRALSLRALRLHLSEIFRSEYSLYQALREKNPEKNLFHHCRTLTDLASQIESLDEKIELRREVYRIKMEKEALGEPIK